MVVAGNRIGMLRGSRRRRLRLCVAVVGVGSVLLAVPAAAAPGDLDPGFGTGGKVVTDLDSAGVGGIVIQANGKIVVGGSLGAPDRDFAVARYLPDGSLDPIFGGDGIVTTDFGTSDAVSAVVIQADGKIVAAGGADQDFAVARYRRDGGLDTTFSGDGKATVDVGASDLAADLVIQPDGRIVLAGQAEANLFEGDFALARLNADGSLDTSFGGDGTVTTDFGALDAAFGVALQHDGRIVAAGAHGIRWTNTDFALARYEPDGGPDTTFDSDGRVTTDFFGGLEHANDVVVQPNGMIIVAGATSGGDFDFALARYGPDGSLDARGGDWPLDTSFDVDGRVTTDFPGGGGCTEEARALAIQVDGEIVAAGRALCGFGLARYRYDGSLDPEFGASGLVTTSFGGVSVPSDLALQADGSIVVVGTTGGDFALARYVGDPTPPQIGGVTPGAP